MLLLCNLHLQQGPLHRRSQLSRQPAAHVRLRTEPRPGCALSKASRRRQQRRSHLIESASCQPHTVLVRHPDPAQLISSTKALSSVVRCPLHRKARLVQRCTLQERQVSTEEEAGTAVADQNDTSEDTVESSRAQKAQRPDHSTSGALATPQLISERYVPLKAVVVSPELILDWKLL